jgi:hypothetical protein
MVGTPRCGVRFALVPNTTRAEFMVGTPRCGVRFALIPNHSVSTNPNSEAPILKKCQK